LGLRVFALVLRIRLAAVSLTVKCPLLFMTRFSSSFQASIWRWSKPLQTQLAQLKLFN
jgi:hypothetical protein